MHKKRLMIPSLIALMLLAAAALRADEMFPSRIGRNTNNPIASPRPWSAARSRSTRPVSEEFQLLLGQQRLLGRAVRAACTNRSWT